MAKITRKVLGRASMALLALILALGTTTPAFAQDEDGLERRGFSGVVTVLEEGSITVETEDGESVTVALTENTRVRLPSGGVQNVLEVELKEGVRVAILAELEADGSLTALWTLVKPERPQVEHLLGTVISIQDGVITVVDAQGNEHTVEMPEQVMRGLQIGDIATLVIDQSDTESEEGDQSENPVAQAAVTATQIQERVRAHAEVLRQRAQAGEVPVTTAEERIQFLSELMDTIKAHVQGVLTAVLDKVPPQAQAAIEQARERAGTGFDRAKEAIQRMRLPEGVGSGNIGPPEEIGPPDDVGPSGGIPVPGNAGRLQR